MPAKSIAVTRIFTTPQSLKNFLAPFHAQKVSIGFVPTMGALHAGHLSLVKKSKQDNALTVGSIFVNPTQFDDSSDFENYPNLLSSDMQKLKNVKCDAVFVPHAKDVYPNGLEIEQFNFDGLERAMEGKFRKNHFQGVGTIVKKLFAIVRPCRAYFGEKDFQQLQIIKKLNQKYDWGIGIVACPTLRHADGLAMSSRNARLSPEERQAAPFIFQILQAVQRKYKNSSLETLKKYVAESFKKNEILRLDYFEIAREDTLKIIKTKTNSVPCRAFIAVYAGQVRLIDNLAL